MSDFIGPFDVYQTYDGEFQIIDGNTRTMLDDVFAYDANDQERQARIKSVVDALNGHVEIRKQLREAIDIATRLATDSRAPVAKLLTRINAIWAQAGFNTEARK